MGQLGGRRRHPRVASGRFIDRDKLHYIDFEGKYFSVKGPSITPRSPQGQPVVAALAHAQPVYEFAARSADLVFITPKGDGSLRSILDEVTQAGGSELKIYADVFVSFSGVTDPRSDALVFDGTPEELVELLPVAAPGIDGIRLRPSVNASDLPIIVDEVVPMLQRAGRFRTAYHDRETLRERSACRSPRTASQGGAVMTVPLSILDLSPISEGCDAATALRNSVDLAQHAEQWGYKRYWVAEHHFVAVASSAPAVLIGQIAAATNTNSRRRRRGATRPDHRRRGRRELRHARRVPSRPHRPRRRAVRSAAQGGASKTAVEAETQAAARNGATSTVSSYRRHSTSAR